MSPQASTPTQGEQQHPSLEEHIPESEQWRIIKDSGLLDGYNGPKTRILKRNTASGGTSKIREVDLDDIETDDDEDDYEGPGSDLPDKIFDSILLIIPLTFLWLMMDILVHQQYNIQPSIMEELRRVGRALPAITIMIGLTQHRKMEKWLQILMFWISIATGIRMIYVVNKSPRLTVIRQGPPLATLWTYMIVQLRLPYAVISLLIVAVGIKYLGLKIKL